MYEEYPILGPLAESIRIALTEHTAGDYASALSPENVTVSQNLIGYKPLMNQRNEVKNFFLSLGITSRQFPKSVANTSINYRLVQAISVCIGLSSTFKMNIINLTTCDTTASNSLLIMEQPVVNELQPNSICHTGPVVTNCI